MSQTLDYIGLVNDLRVAQDKAGGFIFVYLYDADDHDRYMLGEDEIVALRDYLNKAIAEHKLVNPTPESTAQSLPRV
jgi:hypothetical protein